MTLDVTGHVLKGVAGTARHGVPAHDAIHHDVFHSWAFRTAGGICVLDVPANDTDAIGRACSVIDRRQRAPRQLAKLLPADQRVSRDHLANTSLPTRTAVATRTIGRRVGASPAIPVVCTNCVE